MHAMETTLTSPRSLARKLALTLAASAAFLVHVPSQAQVFLCVDANGVKELTDRYKPGCKQLDVASSYPAPSSSPRRAASPPRAAPVPATTPADFPRVESSQQKARDNDRREILLDEMRQEERRLAELKAEFKGGEPDRLGNERNYAKYQDRVATLRDSISRSEKNIEALKREIANIK